MSKAGTNTYHASLWEFVRNEQFDARNFFAATRDPLRQNQFGVAGGGPLWIPKWCAFEQPRDSLTHILLVTLGAALVLVGPGAWSVDARLFGWKRINIRNRKS